jgi:hypothetical protein
MFEIEGGAAMGMNSEKLDVDLNGANSSLEQFAAPKSTFVGDRIRLIAKKPVIIYITRKEELWFAENEKLNIYATGADSVSAIRDFESQVIYLYDHYRSMSNDGLPQHARELKALYLYIFYEES